VDIIRTHVSKTYQRARKFRPSDLLIFFSVPRHPGERGGFGGEGGGSYFDAIKTGHPPLGKMVEFVVHISRGRGYFSVRHPLK